MNVVHKFMKCEVNHINFEPTLNIAIGVVS
jgi:hypothetical protein